MAGSLGSVSCALAGRLSEAPSDWSTPVFSDFALTKEDPQHCAVAAGGLPGCAPHGGVAESARVGQQRLPQSLINAIRVIGRYQALQSEACGKEGAGFCQGTPSPKAHKSLSTPVSLTRPL